jgi:hypothetical protein
MKKILIQFVPLACVVCLFTGCAAVTRTATDVGLGAGGAALGGELTHNNPVAIVGGAAGGALLGEGLHAANSKQNDQSYLIPLLFLSACSTAPKLTLRPQQPPPATDNSAVRYPEVLHAYHIGRYADPNDDLIMHEQHVVYRVEENTRWNFHPGPADGNRRRHPHRAVRRF